MNDITTFLRYMCNDWSLSEATEIFDYLDTHIWAKWIDCDRDVARFFFSIDSDCQNKLMRHALTVAAE